MLTVRLTALVTEALWQQVRGVLHCAARCAVVVTLLGCGPTVTIDHADPVTHSLQVSTSRLEKTSTLKIRSEPGVRVEALAVSSTAAADGSAVLQIPTEAFVTGDTSLPERYGDRVDPNWTVGTLTVKARGGIFGRTTVTTWRTWEYTSSLMGALFSHVMDHPVIFWGEPPPHGAVEKPKIILWFRNSRTKSLGEGVKLFGAGAKLRDVDWILVVSDEQVSRKTCTYAMGSTTVNEYTQTLSALDRRTGHPMASKTFTRTIGCPQTATFSHGEVHVEVDRDYLNEEEVAAWARSLL